MLGRKNLFAAAVSCALIAGCGAAPDPQQDPQQGQSEQTASTQSADTATCTSTGCTYTGAIRSVDVLTGAMTITAPGGTTVTLTHTGTTVHVSVVPGPMHQVGVVPGPMRWLWMLWNDAIQNNQQAIAFLILLDDLAFHHGRVTITTTDGSTIGSVQPVP